MSEIPWVGLAAIVLMFLIPLVPDWVFERRRTRHRGRHAA